MAKSEAQMGEFVASINGPELASDSFEVPSAGTLEAKLLSMLCTARPRVAAVPESAQALASGDEARRVFERASKSVALVSIDAGFQGSAVALHVLDDGYVEFATNCHVLPGAKKFVVIQRDTAAGSGEWARSGVPRVDELHAQSREVFDVARDQRQVVLQGAPGLRSPPV